MIIISCIFSPTLCHAGKTSKHDNYIKIMQIRPDPSVPLEAGSEVHFEVQLEYYVNEDSANVALSIQRGEYSGGSIVPIGYATESLTPGRGTLILEPTVKVPDTKLIEVFASLMISGQTRTSIVDMKSYKVLAGNADYHDNYIKIIQIQPDPSVPLEAGSEVHFEVQLEYYVNEDSATASLIIQKGEHSGGSNVLIENVKDFLAPGKGTLTLETTVKVPDTKLVEIFTPLTISGQTQTSILDMRSYKVITDKNP